MHAQERRQEILKLLHQSAHPISASALAERFSVTRQVIVGDIALLRSGGADILATPRGYCDSGRRSRPCAPGSSPAHAAPHGNGAEHHGG